jgi:hypothetical protein
MSNTIQPKNKTEEVLRTQGNLTQGYWFLYVPATSTTSCKAFLAPANKSTKETNKAGDTRH